MAGVSAETDIALEQGKVFEYLANVEKQGEWMEMVESTEHTGGTPGETGATYRQVMSMMGNSSESNVSITEATAPTTLRTAGEGGPMKVETLYELSAKGDGTRLKMTVELPKAAAMMRPMIKKQLKGTLEQLKNTLER